MRGWSPTWWGAAALVVAAEALLLRLAQAQAVLAVPRTAGTVGGDGAWIGRDVPGYDSFSRVVYGLPQAWSVLGLVLVAVGVALWRESRMAVVAVPFALVTGILPAERPAVSAALLATAALAVAAARSAPRRSLRLAGWLFAAVVLLLAAAGAGRAPATVEAGSTAPLAGRAAVVVLLVVAVLFAVVAAAPRPATSGAGSSGEPPSRLRSEVWAVVAVAAAVQVALLGAVLVGRLPDLAPGEPGGRAQYVTVAIAQFTGEPQPVHLPPVDLLGFLTVLATLSAAVAAVAAVHLRAVHPLVLAAVACFVLAVLPVGAAARSTLALGGFAILAFVALRAPRDDLG